MFTIPQSTQYVLVFKAFSSTDHVTEATGKTIVITISKAGGAFGNPNAGATNATEISSGWYKVTLDTTDTNTVGGLAVRGAVSGIDDVGVLLNVVKATNGGWTALPDTAVTTNASLITSGTGTAQLSVSGGVVQADVAKIATAAVSTSTAQLGVNVVNFGGSAGTFASGIPSVNASQFGGASVTATTSVTIPASSTLATTTGAVGSVTGAVGSVTGSVGSIASGGIAAASFAAGAIDASAIAANAIGASELASDAANEIADAILDRDMSTGTDSGSTTVRTVRQALRALRNKWTVSGSTYTVYKEDDTTSSWTGTVTSNASADPITANDPAG